MRRLSLVSCTALLFTLGGLSCAAEQQTVTDGLAEPQNRHLWRPRTRSVAVFKNGLGFFLREGEVQLRDGWCLAEQVPPAVFGTLAVYSTNPQEVVDVLGAGPGEVIEFDGRDAPATVEAKRARLEASKHLTVSLSYRQKGAERSAAGRLVSIGPDFAVLDSESNSFAVPVEGISKLQILDLPVRAHVAGSGDVPPAQTTLGMAYLRSGITWIPDYTLKVLDGDTAELTLRGTLVNEAEDLVHCDVNLVVGVPHFLHTNYLAPVAIGQVIRTLGAAVAPQEVQTQIMSRAAITSNSMRSDQFAPSVEITEQPVTDAGRDVGQFLGNLPQLDGPAATDYTVYTKRDVTLRRGEKAIVTLFVKRIKYSHLHRWSPPAAMQHFLVLANSTDMGWTTGPCLAVSGDRPLSEDLLKYTPSGGRAEIPVTTAVNVAHQQREIEIDRKLRAYSPASDVHYDLVTLQGELQLRNFEGRDVELIIDAPVHGKPVVASDDGAMTTDPTQLILIERRGNIRWKINLTPSQTKALTYKYERYVPSR